MSENQFIVDEVRRKGTPGEIGTRFVNSERSPTDLTPTYVEPIKS